jgi:hypothetical protein
MEIEFYREYDKRMKININHYLRHAAALDNPGRFIEFAIHAAYLRAANRIILSIRENEEGIGNR